MGNIFDPLSTGDLSTTQVGDPGVFTGTLPSQLPIFPQQAGAYQIGGNPQAQSISQALTANDLARQVNVNQRQATPIQSANTASQLANQLKIATLQQQQRDSEAQIGAQQLASSNTRFFGSLGANSDGTVPIPTLDAVALSSPETKAAYLNSLRYNTALQVSRLQGQNTIGGIQAQQQIAPLQAANTGLELQGQGSQIGMQAANLMSSQANQSQYQPDFRQAPLDFSASDSQIAQTQLRRASLVNPQAAKTLGIDGQTPVKPQELLLNPKFNVFRQQDPQQADLIYQAAAGRSAQTDIATLQEQHKAQLSEGTKVASDLVGKGKLRFQDGILQRDTSPIEGSPMWKDAGTDAFPTEQVDMIQQAIQAGRVSGMSPQSPADQTISKLVVDQISKGVSKDQALQNVKQMVKDKLRGFTANQLTAPRMRGTLRPYTPAQIAGGAGKVPFQWQPPGDLY